MTLFEDRDQTRKDNAWSIGVGGCAVVAFAALLGLTWYSAGTLFLIFAGILFGVFLNALAELIGKVMGGPHALRLGIVCLLLVAMFSGVVVLGGNTIAGQASQLSATIKSQVGTVKGFLEARGVDTSFLNFDTKTAAAAASNAVSSTAGESESSKSESAGAPKAPSAFPSAGAIASGTSAVLGQTFKVLSGVFEAVGNIFVVIFLGLLFAAQPSIYRKGLLSFVPAKHGRQAERLTDDLSETLQRWLLGQLLTMASLFAVTAIGLTIIGIPGALVLGFVTGLLSFIPTVGAVIAGALIVLASLGSGLTAILSAIGLYLFIQFLEGNVLTPLIQRHAIEIPPATLFAAQIFLGVLFGLWGLALALPLIAIIKVVLRHVYKEAEIKTAAA
ncbi:MAG: AI-2E family transporter [Caulobacter sp.]|nr:AI-2E family transporter [Caulobacter sp.]